ncbi:hypothetical protein NQ317_011550, partial [Molorchus minor]
MCVHRVSVLTGVAKSTVYRVVKNQKEQGKVTRPKHSGGRTTINLDEHGKHMLRSIVHGFFAKNEPPCLKKIHEEVLTKPEIFPKMSLPATHKQLSQLNFRCVKRGRRSILLESENIVAWRRKYLRQIKKYREEKRSIFYLDETWVNEGHVRSKTW